MGKAGKGNLKVENRKLKFPLSAFNFLLCLGYFNFQLSTFYFSPERTPCRSIRKPFPAWRIYGFDNCNSHS